MTCHETRDLFSARIDDALGAAERAGLDAHLATCADCGREWQRFEATVGLLRAVEPARAPAGFVDRVLAAARPEPRLQRLARGLLVPWRVKLPIQAAAILLVAGLAVMIFQRSPEMQQAARAPEMQQAVPAPAAPPAATSAPVPPPPSADLSAAKAPAPAPPPSVAPPAAPPAAPAEPPAAPVPSAKPPADFTERLIPPSSEAVVPRGRQDAAEARAKAAEGQRDSFHAARRAAPPAGKEEPGAKQAPAEQKTGAVQSLGGARLEARVAPADVEARLAAPDRAAAEREIAALVARLGGTLGDRRALEALAMARGTTVELTVPREAYVELTRGLARLGNLRIDREPGELPPVVRMSLVLQ